MVYQLCATFAKKADLAQNVSIRANTMQDLTKSLILLNGELKTLQIASISKLGANAFRVYFKNNPK